MPLSIPGSSADPARGGLWTESAQRGAPSALPHGGQQLQIASRHTGRDPRGHHRRSRCGRGQTPTGQTRPGCGFLQEDPLPAQKARRGGLRAPVPSREPREPCKSHRNGRCSTFQGTPDRALWRRHQPSYGSPRPRQGPCQEARPRPSVLYERIPERRTACQGRPGPGVTLVVQQRSPAKGAPGEPGWSPCQGRPGGATRLPKRGDAMSGKSSSLSWSPEPAPTGDWAADLMVGAKGRARPERIVSPQGGRAAGGGYVTPTPSKPKAESAYPKPGPRSVFTRTSLGNGRVLLRQATEQLRVLQAVVPVGLSEAGFPPHDGQALDADGLSDFRLGEVRRDAQLLPDARRRQRVSVHQGIVSTQRIRHHSLHFTQCFLKRYTR